MSLSQGILYLLICSLVAGHQDSESRQTNCVYSKQAGVKNAAGERVLLEDGTEQCIGTEFCYALWQYDQEANSSSIVAQGCWSAAEMDCSGPQCVSTKRALKSLHNATTTQFCCCKGSLCNYNVSDGAPIAPEPPQQESPPSSAGPSPLLLVSVTVIVALVVACAALLLLRCRGPRKVPAPLPPPLPPAAIPLDSLSLGQMIGRGRYGRVYEGCVCGERVAVKVFPSQHKQNYLNERSIYCLPFMEHPCLPRLIGAEERGDECLLVLTHAPLGCLQEYLTAHTVDFSALCRMAHSVARGLAHLHTEIRKDDRVKPCVAHRDLTSRNILLRADLSCVLCDFGFAIRISGSKYYDANGEEQLAESTSLSEVGTVRYMAPEVLEGAVNLRDCESSLKQIDVYALGLVLWEIASQCADLFQGVSVPEYRAPFVAEIGTHPTMEQLQHLVVKRKARPLFPDIWKDTNPAVRGLKETIEECWDQDAEARLTALCVEERLQELPTLYDRHKAGCTIRPVEFLTLSDDRPPPLQKNISQKSINVLSMPLQPYQGKNPTLERNLLERPVEEVVEGNSLLVRFDAPVQTQQPPPITSSRPLLPPPIPYLQNHVTSPKQPNVPGNGQQQTKMALVRSFKNFFRRDDPELPTVHVPSGAVQTTSHNIDIDELSTVVRPVANRQVDEPTTPLLPC